MKSILAVAGEGILRPLPLYETAIHVAKRFGGRIVGLNTVTAEYSMMFTADLGFALPAEVDRSLDHESHKRRASARAQFEAFMLDHGVTIGPPSPDRATAEWREENGRQDAVVGALGRIYDLIVVERPDKLASLAEATLEDALFESGRPVLMAPVSPPASLGERILVAWNGSTETACTVGLAMPFLKRAQKVDVVSVADAMVPGPSGEDLARSLAAHGISVTARHITGRSGPAGQIFLDEAKTIGADLLIKGAYTQSRLRQLIFGGATRHIIMAAEIPVLLAH